MFIWQRRRDREHSRHVLIVVAFRSEEVPAGHFLRGLRPDAVGHQLIARVILSGYRIMQKIAIVRAASGVARSISQ